DQVAAMRAARLIAVVGISLFLAPLSYAQHGGGHLGGGFSGRGTFSSGHSSGRGGSAHSSSRFVSGLRHIVPLPRFWRSPKPTAPSTASPRPAAAGLLRPPNSFNSQFAFGPSLRLRRGEPPRRSLLAV